jgi:radical SAM superfamily enzyme YgiQ (UPF0313 family)
MSSLGFHIIYDFLNSREDVYCERAVYPYSKTLESSSPLIDFDIVGFSLQYEQDYFNVLEMLQEAGIPLKKSERTREDPLIIAGGPCASSNPSPMSDFIDVFLVGEAEAMLDQFIDTYLQLDNPREELDAFPDIKGVYVPDNPVEMVIVEDMRDAWHPIKQVIPETDDKDFIPAFGRAFLLGVSRGCTRGCRFCMAGCMYRPRREAPLKDLLEIAEKCRQATGLDRVALIGAAVSDYSKIEELCMGLYERDFQITTPSLRIETVSDELLNTLKESGLKTITIAPESTWRVRKVVNKPITDDDIVTIMNKAFNYGLNVKLYFMLGLPTESREDLDDLVKLIRDLEEIPERKSALRISINPFIPKPHTPFQWEDFDFKKMKKDVKFLKSELKRSKLKIDSSRMALIQYVLSMGTSQLGVTIEKSLEDKVPIRKWEKLAPSWDLEDELPWDNIGVGVNKDYLKEEYLKALNGDLTLWCETFGCYHCGACDDKG